MTDNVKDLNLELLVGMRRHLEQAVRLHALFDRMMKQAGSTNPPIAHPTSRIHTRPAEGEVRNAD
jgi:hypothetical protein